MSTRQRKVKKQDEENDPVKMLSRAPVPGGLAKRYLTITILCLLILLGYFVISNDLKPMHLGGKAIDSLAFSLNMQKPIYVIVIDAGSTGTRVLAYAFHASILNGNLLLDKEFFMEVKPGLSSFADDLKKIEASLGELLVKAKEQIPEPEWHKTPITLRATAGLRLLPEHKANAILEESMRVLEASGFKVSKNAVQIMKGVDEGIFSWFTVNYLLDKFHSHSSVNTVAALDLGGGSNQVTFTPDAQDIPKLEKNMYSINAFEYNMSLYTYSYLGYGLMAARKEILTRDSVLLSNEINPKEVVEVRSECVNPIVTTEWSYSGVDYLVRGPVNGSHKLVKTQNFGGGDEDRPIVRFKKCLDIIEAYVSTIPHKPIGLNKHEVYAFSYYFERATELGLIDPFAGGMIKLDKLRTAAMEICEYPNTDQPFMCLDTTYIYVLLRKGFNLEPTTNLYLLKKIKGYEITWALGAAFATLQNEL